MVYNVESQHLLKLSRTIFNTCKGDLWIWRQEAQNDQGQKCIRQESIKLIYKLILHYWCVKLVSYFCLEAVCVTYKSSFHPQLHWNLVDIFYLERHILMQINMYYEGCFFKMHMWVSLLTHDAAWSCCEISQAWHSQSIDLFHIWFGYGILPRFYIW